MPSCHRPPLFEVQECIFHQMTQFIKGLVIIPGFLAEASWWYHRRHSLPYTLTNNLP